jgi:hypothetical protein
VQVYNYSVNKAGDLGRQTFRNNIFVGFGLNGHYPPVVFRDGGKDYLQTSTFVNNIFWSLDGVIDPYVIGWGPDPSYGFKGFTCAQAAAVTTISGCMNVDPKFTDVVPAYYATPGKFNFALRSGSPAIGAGTPLGAPAADLVGTIRGNPPSIGAYEPNSVTAPSAPATIVSSVSCTPASINQGSTTSCTVAISQAALTAMTITLSSGSAAVSIPATASIAAGSNSATFTATASGASSQPVTVAATFGNSSVSTTVTVTAPVAAPALSGISCNASSLNSNASAPCSVTLSAAAGSGGATVMLASSSTALSVPPTVTVAAGATTATFTAATGTVSAGQTVVITATSGGASKTVSIDLAGGTPTLPTTSGTGWRELPNTALQSACPANNFGGINYLFTSYCRYVVDAWNGGVADTKRNRMIIWGGGHSDYSGNEVYALNLGDTPTLTRIVDPSPLATSGCPDAGPDGAPVSRHTYNGLAYLPQQDRMFSFDGIKAPCGNMSGRTWTLDFSNASPQWRAMDPVNGFNPASGSWYGYGVCGYDPNSQTVICNDTDTFLRYDPVSNTYTKLNTSQHVPVSSTGVVDPVRKLMFFMGHEYGATTPLIKAVDLSADSKFVLQDWSSQVSGCDALAAADYPGLQYDPVLDRIVGWPNTGNTVYLFNPATKTCTAQTFPNGPGSAVSMNGTFGRFQYFPALDVFAVVFQTTRNAFLLRLNPPASLPANQSACDLNADGAVDSLDVQVAINQVLGVAPCTTADLQRTGSCNIVDVQRVINASRGGSCITGQ